LNENDSRKWRDVPGQGEAKALISNMMYLGRKTQTLKPKFKAKNKAKRIQAKSK